ncbi:MAG: hypothetical protein WB816_02980 [Methylocystis sp.]
MKPFKLNQRVCVHYEDCDGRAHVYHGRLITINSTHAFVVLDDIGGVVATVDALTHEQKKQAYDQSGSKQTDSRAA